MATTITTSETVSSQPVDFGNGMNIPQRTIEQTSEAIRGMHHIPSFTDKNEERMWAKSHMAAGFRTFARLGYADGASGHISLRDPVNPENFWISK